MGQRNFREARTRMAALLATVSILAGAWIVIAPAVIHAKPCPTCHPKGIVVNTLSDASTSGDGLCSLREAINNSNNPGTDTTGGDFAIATGPFTAPPA